MRICYLMNDKERSKNWIGRLDAIIKEGDFYIMQLASSYCYESKTLNELREKWSADAVFVYILTNRLSFEAREVMGFTPELCAEHDAKVKKGWLEYIEYRKRVNEPLTLEEIQRVIPEYGTEKFNTTQNRASHGQHTYEQ